MDFLEACLDEIALEGLDGITLPSLWIRLETRKPEFPLKLDDASKQYMWKYLIKEEDLRFYTLTQQRGPLQLYDRFECVDPETNICVEKEDVPEDIYPIEVVRDGDIVGSCSTYTTRKDVTEKIRSNSESVHQNLEKWGERLVIVASQRRRTRALLGPEVYPMIELNDKLYCIMERIGRSRWHGEVTQGKDSLTVFNISSKTMFYFRKILKRHNLVTVQVFNLRLKKGLNTYGKLIHLKRFYYERCPIYLGWLEKLTHTLEKKPDTREVVTVMRDELGLNQKVFKKLYQLGEKYVEVDLMLHREMYPEATHKEYLTKNSGHERFIRIIKLKKLFKYKAGCGIDGDDDEESGNESSDVEDDQTTEYERVVEESLMRQAYKVVRKSKGEGISQREMANTFRITRLDARLLCRNLERLGMAKKVMRDVGKQKVHTYVAADYLLLSSEHKKFNEMKDEIIAEDQSDKQSKREHMHQKKKAGTAYMTYRMLKRATMVLEIVKENKLVDNLYMIQKKIIQEEEKEGITTRFDKKSMMRIIDRLVGEGKLQSFKPTIVIGDEEKELHFVIDKEVDLSDPFVTSAVEAAKCRRMAVSSKNVVAQDRALRQQTTDLANPNFNLLKSKLESRHMKYDNDAGRRYGFLTKMKRTMVMHKFIWYLTYGYNENNGLEEDEQTDHNHADFDYLTVDNTRDPEEKDGKKITNVEAASKMDQDGILKDTKVYRDEYTWRRFVPPVPVTKGKGLGWIMFGDILLRMPLSMYFQLVRFNFKVDTIEEYLSHPVKRFLTISQTPQTMRQQLMVGRKFIHSAYDILTTMCGMGLLSFGVKGLKEKEHVFLFLHNNLSLIDTRDSEIKRNLDFTLNSYKGLHSYWYNLEVICLSTDTEGMEPEKADRATKGLSSFPRFRQALREKNLEEIVDDGSIPGDGLGVAGLDSGYWAHLRRNWYMNADKQNEAKRKAGYSGDGPEAKKLVLDSDIDSDSDDVHSSESDADSEVEELVSPSTKGKASVKHRAKSSTKNPKDESRVERGNDIQRGIWSYFEEIKPIQVGQLTMARCKLCGRELKQLRKDSVPLVMHIKKCHKEIKDHQAPVGIQEMKESVVTEFLLQPYYKQDKKTGKRRRASSVWRYLEHTDDTNRVRCQICDALLWFAGKSTSQVKRHLIRFHIDYIMETEKLEAVKAVGEGTEKTVKPTVSIKEKAPKEKTTCTSPAAVQKTAKPTTKLVDQTKVARGGKRGVKHKPKSHIASESKGDTTRKKKDRKKVPYKTFVSRAPYYDDVDKAALKLKTKERVNWTPQEDSLLLLCFVAHTIMVGERRDFIVAFCCVRDLMHRSFSTCADKTSKACQRRMRYMMKEKDTVTSVHAFVGEAVMDQEISNQFMKGKQYVKGHGKKRCEKVFLKLVAKLRDKFKSNTEVQTISLPDSLEEVMSQYDLVLPNAQLPLRHKAPTILQDIHFSVLHNIIHSAMLLSDKSNFTFQLYQIFQQYPEALLMSVFFSMKDDQMVSKIKSYVKDSPRTMLKSTTIPSVSMGAYQMAQKYTYNWYTRYPRRVFMEADERLSNLIGGLGGKEGTKDDCEHSGVEMYDNGGSCAMVVALMAQRKICFETVLPEDIIVLDTSHSESQSSSKRSKKKAEKTSQSDDEEDKLIEEAQKEGNESGRKEQHLGAARVNLSLARSSKNRDIVHLQPTDHVVIKSCTVYVKFTTTEERVQTHGDSTDFDWSIRKNISSFNSQHLIFLHPLSCLMTLRRLRMFLPAKVDLKVFWQACKQWPLTQEDTRAMRTIYEFIKKHEVMGANLIQIWEKFQHLPELEKYLGLFEEQRVIIRVGVTTHRLVSHEFIRPWIVHSYQSQTTQQPDEPTTTSTPEQSTSDSQQSQSGDIHTSWMDEVLLTGSSYNPYKKSADIGHQRKAEKKKREREELEKMHPWLASQGPEEAAEKETNPDPGDSVQAAEKTKTKSYLDTIVKCTSCIKVVNSEKPETVDTNEDGEPGAKKRKMSTTDDDSDMEAVTYEGGVLEEEQTALKVKPALDSNSTLSAGGARVRLPKPCAQSVMLTPSLQPIIPTGPRVRFPVSSQSQAQTTSTRPPPFQFVRPQNTSDLTNTVTVYPRFRSTTVGTQGSVPVSSTTTPPQVIMMEAQSVQSSESGQTLSSASASQAKALPKAVVNPVTETSDRSALTSVIVTTSFSSGSQSVVRLSSPSTIVTPTVTVQPGAQAFIFRPDQPLRLSSPTRGSEVQSSQSPSRVVVTPPALKTMKISHTGEIEMIETPIIKKNTAARSSRSASHSPRGHSSTTPPTVQSPKSGSGISKKLETYIMGTLKESFKGNPIKVKVIPAASVEQQGKQIPGSATQLSSTQISTIGKSGSVDSPVVSVLPGQSLLKSQGSIVTSLGQQAVSIIRNPVAVASGGESTVSEVAPRNPRSLLKSNVAKSQETALPSSSSPRRSQRNRRSSSRSGGSADDELPQTDGPADERKEKKQKQTELVEDTGATSKQDGKGVKTDEKESSKSTRLYQRIRIVPRPWRTPDGAINRPILRMMLEGIMTYLLTKPGITHELLVKRYNPILQPVCLDEILEILISIGCVTKGIFHRREKTSLFSSRPVFRDDQFQKSNSVVTFTPTIDCVLKLGQFETQLQEQTGS